MKKFLIVLALLLCTLTAVASADQYSNYPSGAPLLSTDIFIVSKNGAGTRKITGANLSTFLIEDAITNGTTDKASSSNAVFDGLALKQNLLTNSAGLAGALSDETGSGLSVFATSPTLTTPTLGVATATSINKVALTAPATSATLTIANGKTLTANNTLTLSGTDGSTAAFGAGGTVAYLLNKLSDFAATTSAELRGLISDETGTGALVFGTTPTLTTPVLGVATATSVNKVAITAPASGSTLTIADGATLTASANADVSGTNTGDQNTFRTYSVSGQSDVVADGTTDTMTLVAGANVTLTTDASTDTITIAASGGGGGGGDVSGPVSSTDNALTRWDGTSGDTIQNSTINLDDTGNMQFPNGVGVRTGVTAADTLLLQARDVDGASWTTFGTLTANNTPTFDLAASVTKGGNTIATTANILSDFAATTSAQLAGTISDETGSGALVFGTSPTLTTPTLGVAAATSVNKVAITAPASGSTLTIVNGATLTASASADVSNTNTGDQNTFTTYAVSGQSNIVADSTTDTFTLAAGTNVTMTTNAGTDTLTINASGGGDASGPASATDNAIARFDTTTGKLLQNSTVSIDDTGNTQFPAGVGLRTGTTAADTLLLQARDVDGTSWTTFGTLTANNTPTFDLSSAVTKGGSAIITAASTLNNLSATTSSQLAGTISDETGSGALVFGTSPTLTTPTLGVAAGTSFNKVAITAPATAATLTIADGATLSAPSSATVSNTNTGDQNLFGTISVSGQSDVVADTTSDGLTLVAGTNVTITTNASTDTVTISASGGAGSGDVVGPSSATNNGLALFDGTTGKLLKDSAVTLGTGVGTFLTTPSSANLASAVTNETGTGALVFANGPALGAINAASLTLDNGGNVRTGTSAANVAYLSAYDVDGTTYVPFATLTANNTPTMDLSTSVTMGGTAIYRSGGTDVAVADGGTGAGDKPTAMTNLGIRQEYCFAGSDYNSTALTAGTDVILEYLPAAMTITSVRAYVRTAPSGLLTIDVNEGTSSILSTKLTIDSGEKTSGTAATAAVISDASFAANAELRVDIDSTTAGKGLVVCVGGYF